MSTNAPKSIELLEKNNQDRLVRHKAFVLKFLRPKMPKKGEPEDINSGLLGLEITAVLFAALFVMGWGYAQAYFSTFRVNLYTELDIDVMTYPILAWRVILETKSLVILIAIFFAILYMAIDNWLWGLMSFLKRNSIIFLPIIVVSFFFTYGKAFDVGYADALRDMDEKNSQLPRVEIVLAKEVDVRQVNGPDKPLEYPCKLLLGHHRSVYFLVNCIQEKGLQQRVPLVVLVPDAVISAITIEKKKEKQ
ncbi:MAG: hypothetical protein WCB36_04505 [Burkholderiales bacterium]